MSDYCNHHRQLHPTSRGFMPCATPDCLQGARGEFLRVAEPDSRAQRLRLVNYRRRTHVAFVRGQPDINHDWERMP